MTEPGLQRELSALVPLAVCGPRPCLLEFRLPEPADPPGPGVSARRAHVANLRRERKTPEPRNWECCRWPGRLCDAQMVPHVARTGVFIGHIGTWRGTCGAHICVLGGSWALQGCLHVRSAHVYLRAETLSLCELSKVCWPSRSPAPAWIILPVL